MVFPQSLFGWFAVLLAVLVGTGCNNKPDAKVATQVAAKVNGDEITVHQINQVLASSPSGRLEPETITSRRNEILNTLIDQQLAKQQAMARKLDRSPTVMETMEAARNQILARAYLEQIAKSQPDPTSEEVKKYYDENPELFAQRRVFSLEEIVVEAQEELATPLRHQVQKVHSMKEIAAWLTARGAKFNANRGVRAAEQIPLEILPKLQEMKDGEIQILEAPPRLHILRLVASQAMPVDEATANASIQRFLRNQRSNEAIAQEMKQLKDRAKIDYVGEFLREPSTTQTQPGDGAPAAAAAPPPTSGVEKGVRGLF